MNDRSLFTIGEFSKVTGLTVKTLRFYHEQGLLNPSRNRSGDRLPLLRRDPNRNGQDHHRAAPARFFARGNRGHPAFVCRRYRSSAIRSSGSGNRSKRGCRTTGKFHDVSINSFPTNERLRETMQNTTFEVQQKSLEPMLIAGVRMKGKYSDCGRGFARIGKRFGRQICGKAFLLALR